MMQTQTKPISIGIVGLGQFGVHFVELYQRHPLVQRVALCDIDPTKLAAAAKRFGVTETYASLDEICKSDLDAIAIITQPWLHAAQAIQVMQSGKHAYSAVPIVSPASGDGDETLEWCNRLIDTTRRTGQRYMMGETTYYRPETVMCRKRAAEFGNFVFMESEYLHDTWLPGCNLIDVQKARTGLSEAEIYAAGADAPMHYPVSLGPPEPFGRQLWALAQQRGWLSAHTTAVVGDGAAWIWNLAERHFPTSTHIIDWYHAKQHLWTAAHGIAPDVETHATAWVDRMESALFAGQTQFISTTLTSAATLSTASSSDLLRREAHSTAAPISIMNAHMVDVAAFGYCHPNDVLFRADSPMRNPFSHETALFTMSNGAIAQVTESRRNGHTGHEGVVRLIGTEASFERDTSDEYRGRWITKTQSAVIEPRDYRDALPPLLAEDLGGHGGSHAYLANEFVSACAEDRHPTVNAWEAARYVAAGVMAHKSALKNGERLRVPDWGDAPVE